MPFVVIRGTFHVRGYSPDGDSIRFQANNNANWSKLDGVAQLNGRGHAQLRLEAIDTLETHYNGLHQPKTLAVKALDFLLHHLQITGVQFDALMRTVTAADDGKPGYILSREAEDFGRPVAFAFSGDPPEDDGASVFVTAERIKGSVNYLQLLEGLAYPTYYTGLFSDLRREMTKAVETARAAYKEIWAVDVTNTLFDVPDLQAVTDTHVILPKLFRRLADYLDGGGSAVGFKAFLAAREDEVTVISSTHFTHFDTLVDEAGSSIRLTERPENLMFAP
jgi:hypothetical protein